MKSINVAAVAILFSVSVLPAAWADGEALPVPGGLRNAPVNTRVDEIVKASGVPGGLCVQLGATNGNLAVALEGTGKFVVHDLCLDETGLDRVRGEITASGACGRASAEKGGLSRLPYADNLVNLLLIESFPFLAGKGLDLKEVLRVLAPNGVCCAGGAPDPGRLRAAGFSNVRVAGAWTLAVAPRPKEMDDWPRFDHGPDGNPVSQDTTIRPATGLRWRIRAWAMHTQNVLSGWVSAGGRLFYCLREMTPDGHRFRYILTARDAYNGLLLWEKPLKAPLQGKYGDRNVVATADRLYLCPEPNGGLVALDAATGAELKAYVEGGRPECVLLDAGRLYLSAGGRSWALDAASGAVLWESKAAGAVLLADGQLFGEVGDRKLVCLDPVNGQVKWEAPHEKQVNKYNSPFYYGGILAVVALNATREDKYRICLQGFSPKDGHRVWSFEPRQIWRKGGCYMGEVFGAQGLIWAHADVEADPASKNTGKRPSAWVGLDPATGEVRKRFDDATGEAETSAILAQGIHRCNRGRATENYCLSGTYEFFEWKTGRYQVSNIARSTCGTSVGMLPANGLVYLPPPTCVCRSYMQRGGFQAFAGRTVPVESDRRERLEPGPAMGAVAVGAAGADDWPCYRHDPAHSGATAGPVPAGLKPLWETPVGAGLTAVSVAGGRVFAAASAEHRVVALDVAGGKPIWSFTAGGRVDSPPTVSGTAVLFGCRDGWVYCLRATDGKLVWRFRAAPAEELIMVDGQLESAWPVHGSVTLLDGVAWCAAGWHTGLDGGISLWGLRPADGQVVLEKRLEKLPGPFATANFPVALLGSDGKTLWMGRWEIDVRSGTPKYSSLPRGVVGFGASGFLDNEWAQFSNTKERLNWSDGRAQGRMLVSGPEAAYGVLASRPPAGYGPEGPQFGMGQYRLFGKKERGDKGWMVQLPVEVKALVLAGPTLFAAGAPDPEVPEFKGVKDPKRLAQIAAELPEERLSATGGELRWLSAADGKELGALTLDAPPVFDGLAAAGGRLYLSTRDGKVRCYGHD